MQKTDSHVPKWFEMLIFTTDCKTNTTTFSHHLLYSWDTILEGTF